MSSGVQPVLGGLVDVGAGVEQQTRRGDVALARGKRQRREAAPAAADEAGHDDLGVVVGRRGTGRRGRLAAPPPLTGAGTGTGAAAAAGAARAAPRPGAPPARLGPAPAGAPAAATRAAAARAVRGERVTRRAEIDPVFVLPFELLFVGAAGGLGAHVALLRFFHRAGIDALRHVVARQTGAARLGGMVGAGGEQHRHRFGVPLLHRPHQRGGPAQPFFGVDVRARFDEQLHRLRPPVARRIHQHRLAVGAGRLDVGARLHQPVDQRRAAVERRHRQRRHAGAIDDIGFGPGTQQRVGGLDVVVIHRPVQRRGAVTLRRVDVGLLRSSDCSAACVAVHDRVGDFASGAGQPRGTDRDDQKTGAQRPGRVSHIEGSDDPLGDHNPFSVSIWRSPLQSGAKASTTLPGAPPSTV